MSYKRLTLANRALPEEESPAPNAASSPYPPAPEATHPGEVYEVEITRECSNELGHAYVWRGDDRWTLPPESADPILEGITVWPGQDSVLRRLVHCRNLLDGPGSYAEHYEGGVERSELDADIAAACALQNERLARRLAERIEAEIPTAGWGLSLTILGTESRGDRLLAVCREEVARWAEPDEGLLGDASPGIDLTLRNGDAVTDAEMLDYLDSLPRGMEAGWKVRPSTTGRGWRLLTTRETPNYPTVREAIRAFHDEREEGVWCPVELGREEERS